ncbi:MAG: hypothetical protein ACOY35_10300 [Bacillota bacterium]
MPGAVVFKVRYFPFYPGISQLEVVFDFFFYVFGELGDRKDFHEPIPFSKISAISHQPSAISHQPSAISHQPSAISHQPSAISHQPSAISQIVEHENKFVKRNPLKDPKELLTTKAEDRWLKADGPTPKTYP